MAKTQRTKGTKPIFFLQNDKKRISVVVRSFLRRKEIADLLSERGFFGDGIDLCDQIVDRMRHDRSMEEHDSLL